ncbi:hypothetical protein L211DRAFT_855747 [Terfezia boudieri ATCC MYA-4762]|uniref:F-box domain-containing protein n=1 Tax=Terfezia boudieri ATCC MYA-4762 TaxID=1051890 RepID=A0A3N4M0C9_9PEZI|nr:hypothetical protein L211DRAFT_855747 [Terfezia boudieri ATCC MYA-4762]
MPMKALELQCDLILFLSLRSLSTQGSASELAQRLVKYDLAQYRGMEMEEVEEKTIRSSFRSLQITDRKEAVDADMKSSSEPLKESHRGIEHTERVTVGDDERDGSVTDTCSKPRGRIRAVDRMPPELWSEIFEHLGDWLIANALRIRTRLKRPWDWEHASELDVAILTGSLEVVKEVMYSCSYTTDEPMKFTESGADVMVRWGYVELLDFFFKNSYRNFLEVFQKDHTPPNEVAIRIEIPWLASRYGQTTVLDWWLANTSPDHPPAHFPPLPTPNSLPLPPLYRKYDEGALNQASWKGYIQVLQWWKDSGLQLRIGDVMDWATVGGHISVLEWWKHSGENTNIMHRDALCIASTRGKIEFLEWFRNSGLQLTYGNDILAIITKKNKPESLEWWAKSGLRIEYAISDIWEAIEDATTKGDEARDWWVARGIQFDGLDSEEWMRLRVL